MTIRDYRVQVVNQASASENLMHSDEMAQRYGFAGALVAGVTVFGHMTYPLVREFGVAWLSGRVVELNLNKPAYDDDWLDITSADTDSGVATECYNASKTLLATVTTGIKDLTSPSDPRAMMSPADRNPPREEITWDNFIVGAPFAAYTWRPDADLQRGALDELQDDLDIYTVDTLGAPNTLNKGGDGPPVHPLLIAKEFNAGFTRHWLMPAWIHVTTRITLRETLRLGDEVEIRTLPIERFERGGHQFGELYMAFLVDGRVAAEGTHRAIFKVAERA